MEIRQVTLENCDQATSTVVVIDVIRAFTTAAYAFAAGARDIVLVSAVAEAFALKKCAPGVLLMGEEPRWFTRRAVAIGRLIEWLLDRIEPEEPLEVP